MSITKYQTVSVRSGNNETVDFGTYVLNASVAVQGYNVSYGGDDHGVKSLNLRASMLSISGSSVEISAICTMGDSTNKTADGTVQILVIAECES
jgi:hypothetical protein